MARPARGFVYMALIVFFGIIAISAAYSMMSGAALQRRNAEDQLIFVGGEFRRAIESYYWAAADLPPGAPRYPARLEDLLADPRQKNLTRYLRQIYADPLTGRRDWGLVRAPDGGIMGVYSKSPAKAVKLYGFPLEFKYLEGKTRIADWQFVYAPPLLPPVLDAAAPASVPAAPATPTAVVPAATDTAGAAPPAAAPTAANAPPTAPAPPATPGKSAPDDGAIDEKAIDRAIDDILSGKSKLGTP
ncbi:MAG TPA: type II secretion system protein [Burkholderiales bacterium]